MAWSTDARERTRRLKSIIGGSAGNLVEWYDWYVYSAFAIYFAKSFFPSGDATAQLLSAAAVFAAGFVMRPIGAWIMGGYADRYGRKAGLTLSVMLMCLGSVMIACVPGYQSIGLLAPAILLLARLLQGVSVGGEYGASATYLSEMAGQRHRGFFASFQYVTLVGGQLIALVLQLVLQSVMSEQALESWGWRIPFAVSAVLALAVFYLRRGLEETEAFSAMRAETRGQNTQSGGWALFRFYPRQAFLVIAMTAGGTVAFYTYTTYLQKFLVNTAGFSRPEGTRITAAALFVYMLMQPVFGALSDRVGRKALMVAFGLFGTAFTIPIFGALEVTDDPTAAFFLALAALLIVSGYTSINALVKAELFPAHIRALGVALPYALANTIFGGTTEYVALWFKKNDSEPQFFWYVTAMIGLSLIVYICMPETQRTSLIHED